MSSTTSFQLNEIPEEGLTLEAAVPPEDLDLTPEDARVRGPVALNGSLQPSGRHVHVQGRIAGTFIEECVRCLKEYDRDFDVPFTAQYLLPELPVKGRLGRKPGPERAFPGTEEMPEQDEELYTLSGDRLDLAEMLREHIILAMPMQPLCQQGCRGLCPVCGRDRNEGECGCSEARQNSPFSILQERWKGSQRSH
ncbi:YceD family protein [Candidatus Nitrospira bockiana]